MASRALAKVERCAAREATAAESLIEAVREAREAGETWQSIADALGVTAQAAHQRFAKRV